MSNGAMKLIHKLHKNPMQKMALEIVYGAILEKA